MVKTVTEKPTWLVIYFFVLIYFLSEIYVCTGHLNNKQLLINYFPLNSRHSILDRKYKRCLFPPPSPFLSISILCNAVMSLGENKVI